MSRKLWIPLILVIVLLGRLFLWWQSRSEEESTFVKPRLEYGGILLKSINDSAADLDLNLLVDNPNVIGFTLDSLDYEFFITDYRAFQGQHNADLSLEAADSSFIQLPVTLYHHSLKSHLDSLKEAGLDTVDYRVKGKFHLKLASLGDRSLNFDRSFRAPLYKVPESKIVSWAYEELEEGQIKLNFDLMIRNFNVFPYKYKDLSYKLYLGDEERLLSGNAGNVENIGARAVDTMQLPAKISLGEAGDAFWDYLQEGNDLGYRLELELNLEDKKGASKDAQINIEARGDLNDFQ